MSFVVALSVKCNVAYNPIKNFRTSFGYTLLFFSKATAILSGLFIFFFFFVKLNETQKRTIPLATLVHRLIRNFIRPICFIRLPVDRCPRFQQNKHHGSLLVYHCANGWIRTIDPRIKSPMLYH